MAAIHIPLPCPKITQSQYLRILKHDQRWFPLPLINQKRIIFWISIGPCVEFLVYQSIADPYSFNYVIQILFACRTMIFIVEVPRLSQYSMFVILVAPLCCYGLFNSQRSYEMLRNTLFLT
jgi:hypothetical protein